MKYPLGKHPNNLIPYKVIPRYGLGAARQKPVYPTRLHVWCNPRSTRRSAHNYSHFASMLLGYSRSELCQKFCRHKRSRPIRPLFMGAESCEKSESFLATFGPKLWSITLFVHARYGAMNVLCTGLVECGGVFGSKFKSSGRAAQVTPTRGQKIEHAAPLPHALLGTLHTTQSAQLVPPTSMYGTQSGGIQQSACAANRTHARPHGRI